MKRIVVFGASASAALLAVWLLFTSTPEVEPARTAEPQLAAGEHQSFPPKVENRSSAAPNDAHKNPAAQQAIPNPGAGMGSAARPQANSSDKQAREHEGLRNSIRLAYHMLPRQLGLSPQQTQELFDLLTEEALTLMNSAAPGDPIARSGRIASVIGPENLPVFQEYESHTRDYIHVAELGSQLARLGDPLSDEQKTNLAALMIAERGRVAPPSASKPMETLEDLEAEMRWTDDFDRRVLKGAESILSRQQYRVVSEEFNGRAQTRERVLEFQREKNAETGSVGAIFYLPH